MTAQTKKQSTTAELFATVREYLDVTGAPETEFDSSCELSALSELERRMGALVLVCEAATRVLGALALGRGPEADKQRVRDIEALTHALRAALTDASPVFTLEEVRRVLNAVETDSSTMAVGDVVDAMDRLAALRSPGGRR